VSKIRKPNEADTLRCGKYKSGSQNGHAEQVVALKGVRDIVTGYQPVGLSQIYGGWRVT